MEEPLSLRDRFAVAVIEYIEEPSGVEVQDAKDRNEYELIVATGLARKAYMLADAMLEQRKQG